VAGSPLYDETGNSNLRVMEDSDPVYKSDPRALMQSLSALINILRLNTTLQKKWRLCKGVILTPAILILIHFHQPIVVKK
jgi:hypothetical protein